MNPVGGIIVNDPFLRCSSRVLYRFVCGGMIVNDPFLRCSSRDTILLKNDGKIVNDPFLRCSSRRPVVSKVEPTCTEQRRSVKPKQNRDFSKMRYPAATVQAVPGTARLGRRQHGEHK